MTKYREGAQERREERMRVQILQHGGVPRVPGIQLNEPSVAQPQGQLYMFACKRGTVYSAINPLLTLQNHTSFFLQ